MRRTILPAGIILCILICSCKPGGETRESLSNETSHVSKTDLQDILDAAEVDGAILIYDPAEDTYYSNNFKEANESHLPASTFKIPNSIIGLELGILEDEHSIFEWDGTERYLPVWEQDLTLKEAFQTSCVPCYQELARKIGVQRMETYVDKLDFGEIHLDEASLDNFWLRGTSRITPYQQIDFLRRLYEGQLPTTASTLKTIKTILEIESTDTYTISGKTGLSVLDGQKDVGWFVGYVVSKGSTYYIATKITPISVDMPRSAFSPLREDLSTKALKAMQVIT